MSGPLLDAGVDAEAPGYLGRGALHEAVRGDLATLELLLERGAHVHATDAAGSTPLHQAAWWDQVPAIRRLVAAGAALEARDGKGATPLAEAARNGSLGAVRALLDLGADRDAPLDGGGALLAWAAGRGLDELVACLLGAGADVAARDDGGRDALMSAARGGHRATLRLVLEHGASPDARDARGETALHGAAWRSDECVALLLDHGADPNAAAEDGSRPVEIAAGAGRANVVMTLLERGARPSPPPGSATEPALLRAARLARLGCLELLLGCVDDIERPDPTRGTTALLAAAGSKRAISVRWLLEAGANVHARDRLGRTALHHAAATGDATAILLVEAGADADAADDRGATALMEAARLGRGDAITALVAGGAAIERRDGDGRTAVLVAAERGRADALEALLDAGADANARDDTGAGALALAISRDANDRRATRKADDRSAPLVALLLARGAEPGPRAIVRAVRSASGWTLRALLDAGGPADARDERGRPVLAMVAGSPPRTRASMRCCGQVRRWTSQIRMAGPPSCSPPAPAT